LSGCCVGGVLEGRLCEVMLVHWGCSLALLRVGDWLSFKSW